MIEVRAEETFLAAYVKPRLATEIAETHSFPLSDAAKLRAAGVSGQTDAGRFAMLDT